MTIEKTAHLGLLKPDMAEAWHQQEHGNHNADILDDVIFGVGNYTSSSVTVPANSYQDVAINISDKKWDEIVDCVPFLYGTSTMQKGSISLQRVNHSTTSATIRVFNAGNSSVAILFRVLVFGKTKAE